MRSPAGCGSTSPSTASSRRSPRSGPTWTSASQQQLARGGRLVELLKQPAASPFPVGREIVSIWAGTRGHLDDIEVGDVRRFETEFLDYVGHNAEGLYDTLATAKGLDDELNEQLEKLVADFKKQFQPTEGSGK